MDNKTKNNLRYFMIIILFVILYLVLSRKKRVEQSLLDYHLQTTVIDIYRDKNEHNFLFVKYSNGSVELLDYPYEIGDSISKKKGDSIEYIFRNGLLLKNNLIEKARENNLLK